MKTAIYAFSGDPITYGHIDIIKRVSGLFDKVYVAIGVNPNKRYTFSLEDRRKLAFQSLRSIPNVEVTSFTGLLVDYAYEIGASTIIRGIRNEKDFSYENELFYVNSSQRMNIDTFFLPAKQDMSHVSSSTAKALQLEQGIIHEYVPICVKKALEENISGQHIIGITGVIGAGKSFLAQELVELGKKQSIEVHNIDMDKIGHELLQENSEMSCKIRYQLIDNFGKDISLNFTMGIDRKKLGEIVFADPEKLKILDRIMSIPIHTRLRRAIYGKKGIILLNAALLIEHRLTHLCNNNVVIVTVSPDEQRQRLVARGLSPEQIERRIKSQYTQYEKIESVRDSINDLSGTYIIHESIKTPVEETFEKIKSI